jgi:hydantoinase/carbamoylase family amidase
MSDPTVDPERLLARLNELRALGATERGGVTRLAFSALDVEARTLVARWMAEAGLVPEVDAAANLVGRRAGSGPAAGCLSTGSHLDTVVEAGAYDGPYGVVAAVEAAAALLDAGRALQHELVVVVFANEEGARSTAGMSGSRALVGDLPADELASADDGGVSLGQRLADAGGDPTAVGAAAWEPGSVAAFVELHVEQGPVLDQGGRDLGVVSGFTGRLGVDIEVVGQANHAGTTPMDLRQDAVGAAAEVVLAIEALARDGLVRVATCGRLEVTPNVRNVIPGRVVVKAELRDLDDERLLGARPAVERVAAEVAARRGVAISVAWGEHLPPMASAPVVVDALRAAAEASGLPWQELPSGAGHDAQILGRRFPIGMAFVPSAGGISHAPEEHTEPRHLVAGAQLLLDALLRLDGTA